MLIRDENCRALQRALPQHRPGRRHWQATRGHIHIPTTGQDVDRIPVYEAATVVAHVDDDTVLAAIVGVEIHVQAAQRAFGHIVHVRVSESSATHLVDVLPIELYPLAV